MSKQVYILKSVVGMDNRFLPDYQAEFPVEFNALVGWYMHTYHNENEPDRYLQRTRHAVEYANKSIMLDKLGIDSEDDLESQNPEAFKSLFCDLAKTEAGLTVDGLSVHLEPSLSKSLDGSDPIGNELYETLWLRTFDTLRQTGRM
jgi:hypothetical protein